MHVMAVAESYWAVLTLTAKLTLGWPPMRRSTPGNAAQFSSLVFHKIQILHDYQRYALRLCLRGMADPMTFFQ